MHSLQRLVTLVPVLALAACAAPADSSSDQTGALEGAPAVPQAPLIQCVDPANPANKAVITVTNDLDLSWEMFGARGTSALVGAGFTFAPGDDATTLTLLLQNGRRMKVRGDFEEERLLTLDAPEGRLDCGPTSRLKAYNIRVLLDATSTSFEKRAELARCSFGGEPETVITVRPAMRGAGAIVEGGAPNAGAWFLMADTGVPTAHGARLTGKGATLGADARPRPLGSVTLEDALTSDAAPEHAFPASTCRVGDLSYALSLIAGDDTR